MTLMCDVCDIPATVIRPATRNRELALYCDYCAERYLGWGDTYRPLTEKERGA